MITRINSNFYFSIITINQSCITNKHSLILLFKYRFINYTENKKVYFTGKEQDRETGLYYYGARYLDPKTSRLLSGDPAMGDYIPGAGKEKGNLPNGGIYNHLNLHTFHYSNNNPIKYRDPDGRTSEEDIQTALDAVMAASPNATTSKLSDLVNTGNLAGVIKGNDYGLDTKTRLHYNSSSQADIQNDLDNVNVIMGVDQGKAMAALAQLGMNVGPSPEAITVGNTILVFGQMSTDGNGRIINPDDADLLGHEAIHSLQSAAAGGVSAFVDRYKAFSNAASGMGRDPYYGNHLELGPYNFGPTNTDARAAGSIRPTIFSMYPGWHR